MRMAERAADLPDPRADLCDFYWQIERHHVAAVNSDEHNRESEMKTSQMIQSKFLKKDDFPSPEVLTIKHCALEEVGRGDTRWVIYFREKAKGIVLNATKIKQLEAAYGDDSDYWTGHKVKVSHDPTVMMGTQQVGGIKFSFPPAGQRPSAPPPPPPPVEREPGFDDDLGGNW